VALRLRLDKPWRPLTAEVVDRLPGQLGVYQIADAKGTIVYIGQAGARTAFGLRSELQREASQRASGHQFRRGQPAVPHALVRAPDGAPGRPRQPARGQRQEPAACARQAESVVKINDILTLRSARSARLEGSATHVLLPILRDAACGRSSG